MTNEQFLQQIYLGVIHNAPDCDTDDCIIDKTISLYMKWQEVSKILTQDIDVSRNEDLAFKIYDKFLTEPISKNEIISFIKKENGVSDYMAAKRFGDIVKDGLLKTFHYQYKVSDTVISKYKIINKK